MPLPVAECFEHFKSYLAFQLDREYHGKRWQTFQSKLYFHHRLSALNFNFSERPVAP